MLITLDLVLRLVHGAIALPLSDPAIASVTRADGACRRTLEALAIARTALPHLHTGDTHGIAGAFSRLDATTCWDLTEEGRRQADPDYLAALRASAAAEAAVLPPKPWSPWPLRVLGLSPPPLDPKGGFAALNSVVRAWPGTQSGQGLWYYLRCDYPLLRAPVTQFYMADLYLGRTDPGLRPDDLAEIRARLAACGLTAAYGAQMAEIIQRSDMLPVVYQK
jgi:hypothetical protein